MSRWFQDGIFYPCVSLWNDETHTPGYIRKEKFRLYADADFEEYGVGMTVIHGTSVRHACLTKDLLFVRDKYYAPSDEVREERTTKTFTGLTLADATFEDWDNVQGDPDPDGEYVKTGISIWEKPPWMYTLGKLYYKGTLIFSEDGAQFEPNPRIQKYKNMEISFTGATDTPVVIGEEKEVMQCRYFMYLGDKYIMRDGLIQGGGSYSYSTGLMQFKGKTWTRSGNTWSTGEEPNVETIKEKNKIERKISCGGMNYA